MYDFLCFFFVCLYDAVFGGILLALRYTIVNCHYVLCKLFFFHPSMIIALMQQVNCIPTFLKIIIMDLLLSFKPSCCEFHFNQRLAHDLRWLTIKSWYICVICHHYWIAVDIFNLWPNADKFSFALVTIFHVGACVGKFEMFKNV